MLNIFKLIAVTALIFKGPKIIKFLIVLAVMLAVIIPQL